jgi:hypothetical protein
MKKLINRENLLSLYILIPIFFIISSSNWGLDPLHDGATFPSAVAFAEGKMIFSEVQNQYGLVQAFIEGIVMKVFGPYLIIQRLTGTVIIMFIALFMYLNLKLTLKKNYAKIIVIMYLSIFPSWNTFSTLNWPENRSTWPNNYGILFLVIFLYSVASNSETERPDKYILSGISLSISAFCRIQFLVASFIILIALIIILKQSAKKIISGYLATSLIIIAFMWSNHALEGYFEQIIKALFYEGENSVSAINVFDSIKFLVAALTGTFILFLIASLKMHFHLKLLVNVLFILVSSYAIYPFTSNKNGKVFSFLEMMTGDLILSIIPAFLILGTLLMFSNLFAFMKSTKKIRNYQEKVNLINYVVCLTTLLQIHNLSPDYLYMILPVFIIVIFKPNHSKYYTLFSRMKLKRQLMSSVSTIGVSLMIVSNLNFVIAQQKMDFSFTSPVYKFMKTSEKENQAFINTVYENTKDMRISDKVSVNCSYGLFSVNVFGYAASSKYPWNLLTDKMLQEKFNLERKVLPKYVINCNSKKGNPVRDLYRAPNYRIKGLIVGSNKEMVEIYEKIN